MTSHSCTSADTDSQLCTLGLSLTSHSCSVPHLVRDTCTHTVQRLASQVSVSSNTHKMEILAYLAEGINLIEYIHVLFLYILFE